MDSILKKNIIKDKQIKKFSAYGLLKNLAFFKPYLIIYLMANGLDFFQIGLLFSIREIIIYVFEIPSGIIADYYGRKKELYMCFSFYIISFVFFAFSKSFFLAAIAMAFFGLGEAFRSGTHKAMILSYLEIKGWKNHKAFVYGRTRSFSLIGSAINALLSIILILSLPSSKYIFLASIIPYIADFILIATYPNYLDKEKDNENKKGKKEIKFDLLSSLKNPKLRSIVLNQGLFEAVVKSTKDMIQPVLKAMVLTSGIIIINSQSMDNNMKIIIGIAYFIINITSSYLSRNAYRLKNHFSSDILITFSFAFLGIILLFISASINFSVIVLCFIFFLILHNISDIRKPIFVDLIDNHMEKGLRATVLSIKSQISAITTAIIAPLFGYIADKSSIGFALLIIGGLMFIYSFVITIGKKTHK